MRTCAACIINNSRNYPLGIFATCLFLIQRMRLVTTFNNLSTQTTHSMQSIFMAMSTLFLQDMMIQVVLHLADSPVRSGYDEALTSICEEECGHNQFKVWVSLSSTNKIEQLYIQLLSQIRFMFVARS